MAREQEKQAIDAIRALKEELDLDESPVVLFVHGYAYGFDRACRRVSDLQVVLGDSVRVVLFSWPSTGNPLHYGGDREALSASLPALIATIRLLADTVGADALGRGPARA